MEHQTGDALTQAEMKSSRARQRASGRKLGSCTVTVKDSQRSSGNPLLENLLGDVREARGAPESWPPAPV